MLNHQELMKIKLKMRKKEKTMRVKTLMIINLEARILCHMILKNKSQFSDRPLTKN
jgi:hypothetical protein